MAGTVPTITPGSITNITGLEERPIFFLHLNGAQDANLVVKGEAGRAHDLVSIKWGSKLMKNVTDNRVNTKIMTFAEFNIFRKAAFEAFEPYTHRHQLGFVSEGFHAFPWVKMPFVACLSDAGEVVERTKGAPALKPIVVKFQENSVWYALGKVVAVDMFIGNYDRFDPEGRWINKGNVMFVADPDEPLKAIGLDTFDPTSPHRNLTAPGHYDELRILTDSQRRNEFASACVRSVGQDLMNAFGKAGMFTFLIHAQGAIKRFNIDELPGLYVPFMSSFAAGIAAGADDLKQYLQARVAREPAPVPAAGGWRRATPSQSQKAIPQGILDRMAYLGW